MNQINRSNFKSKKNASFCLTGGETASKFYSNPDVRKFLKSCFYNFYFTDERAVNPSSLNSNFHSVSSSLFTDGVTKDLKLNRIRGEAKDLVKEATRYASILPKRIDLLLLSVGEDGHIASIFPRHVSTMEKNKKVVPVYNAPKKPDARLTITPVVILSAIETIVMAAGTKKGKILAKALIDPKNIFELPVRLTIGTTWVLDQAASKAFFKEKPTNFHNTRVVYV